MEHGGGRGGGSPLWRLFVLIASHGVPEIQVYDWCQMEIYTLVTKRLTIKEWMSIYNQSVALNSWKKKARWSAASGNG